MNILPCPFCGSNKPMLRYTHPLEQKFVHCRECCIEVPLIIWSMRHSAWISVKDQLPEDDKEYLVYCKFGVYIDHFLPSQKSFVNDHVTHWMPLPKPPSD